MAREMDPTQQQWPHYEWSDSGADGALDRLHDSVVDPQLRG